MNKLVIEQKDLKLENVDVLIEDIRVNELNVSVSGEVNCGISKLVSDVSINIYLEDNAKLNLNFLVHLKNIKNKIHIYNGYNSLLNLNYSCTYEGDNILCIYNDISVDKSNTNIKVRSVEENGRLEILAEGVIFEDTFDNIYSEDIKALTNNNESIKILPNLIVKTNSVIANHNATISNVDEKELFYLMQKGISCDNAIKLIKAGFLKGILMIDELKK